MIKSSVTPEEVVTLLNEMLSLDPNSISALINTHVVCNEEIVKHESIQVRAYNGKYEVGLLGVLNGIFGTTNKGMGIIAAAYDNDDDTLLRFVLLNENGDVIEEVT